MALLEAERALPWSRAFVDQVRDRAWPGKCSEPVAGPGVRQDHQGRAEAVMGRGLGLNLAVTPPAVILMRVCRRG